MIPHLSSLDNCKTTRELRHALTLNDMVFAAINLKPTREQWDKLHRVLMLTADPTDEELNDPELRRMVGNYEAGQSAEST